MNANLTAILDQTNYIRNYLSNISSAIKRSIVNDQTIVFPYSTSILKKGQDGNVELAIDVIDPYYASSEFFSYHRAMYCHYTYESLSVPYFFLSLDDWNAVVRQYYTELLLGTRETRKDIPEDTVIESIIKEEYRHYASLYGHKNVEKYFITHHDNFYAIKDKDGNFFFGFCYKYYSNQIYNFILNPAYNCSKIYEILDHLFEFKNYGVIIDLGLEEYILKDFCSNFKIDCRGVCNRIRYDYNHFEEHGDHKIMTDSDNGRCYEVGDCGCKFLIKKS